MNILVTGGSGFIGSNLVKRLLNDGHKVTITTKYNSIIDNVRVASFWEDIEVIEADLRNADSCKQFDNRVFEIVYHLAAYNHVGDSFLHVQEALNSNLLATSNLLESGIKFDKLIYTATSEVYGFQESVPFTESMIPFPISPYAVGKYAGELYARMRQHKDNSLISIIRPFNTFGPFQSERAVIPELIIKCLRGIPIETTKGTQTREFNYVDNIVDGFIRLATSEEFVPGPINIGSNTEIAICDLVTQIHEACDSSSDLLIGALGDRPTEIWRMCADYSKAKSELDWKPKISFEDGLSQTVSWYKKYIDVFFSDDSMLLMLNERDH